MPELPEVETVVRSIRPRLVGRRIDGVDVRWERTLGGLDRESFAHAITGARIARVWRRAKFIVADLERKGRASGALVGHLRMTGRMHVEARAFDPGPYVKVSLALDDGRLFHFVDVRKFGRLMYAVHAEDVLGDLGPEPLDDAFTAEKFHSALRAKKRALKPLLLDQSFVAGLGNIYVDEALHRAGLHPLARSEKITLERAACLREEIRATLTEAIEREGSSFDAFYRTPEGRPGSYQHQFRVYGRDGKPCRTCGTTIVKFVVAQRGTHVCRRCQPKPRVR